MATTLDHVRACLDEVSLRYHHDEENDALIIGFLLDGEKTGFRDTHGKARVQVVVRVTEDGEFITAFTPHAWNLAGCPHLGAVFEALVTIQSQYKMVRFEHDPADGELRPNVEMPLEDAELGARQLHRVISGIVDSVQRYDAVIRHARDTGEVSFALARQDRVPSAPQPEIDRLRRLIDEAGGLDELVRMVGGMDGEGDSDATGGEESPPTDDRGETDEEPGSGRMAG